ncbi:MAG: thermonuclease family protein [Cyclobacteriaceae bacterium]|nr:thermonuclease family protein [Cyclobacteriaceae bacterium]
MKSLGTLMVNLLASVVMAFNPITGKVATVVDGNTLVVISEGDTYQVVLHDVDSPEPGQPYAEEARMHLEKILLNKNITVELTGKDRHGNYLGCGVYPCVNRFTSRTCAKRFSLGIRKMFSS